MGEFSRISSKHYSWTVLELLLVAFTCTFLIWCAQCLWRRRKLYKSASQVPGPFALPFIGCALYFLGSPYDIFSSIMMMFNKYPRIFKVWFGPRLFYAISDPKYFEILLPTCLRKEPLYDKARMIVGDGLFTALVPKWKKNRKMIAPTFNQKILDNFVEIFNEQAEMLVQQLQKYCGKGEFDVFHVISKCTLDTICESAMGVKVNAQTKNAEYTKWADRIMEIIFLRIFVFWYHYDNIFHMTNLSKECQEIIRNMKGFSGKVVREKKKAFEDKLKDIEYSNNGYFDNEPMKRKAFLDYLIEIRNDEKKGLSEEELEDEVNTFIIAGSDTTASTICFAFTMLGLHQDLQEKVYNEITEIIGHDRPVDPSDLPKLKYTERFIKETLRLFPIAGIIVRAVDEDVDIGDYIIPSGCSVVFGILRIQTDEKYWPNPFKFDPDRFLPDETAKRHPCTFVPFSYGPRNCIGPRYAMMVMKTILSHVLRRYKIHTSYQSVKDISLKANLVLRPKDGYKVFIELRKD
ncbi:unnamed protein product [Phaedon cochleariae]|uniref:Cytochrome P450 n=1 Tax=Phaedon cochleariae TaxID=80249 RepID=A0A9N9X122_PHACE|nr:unnamed protein product [Phaedon cochleariae]